MTCKKHQHEIEGRSISGFKGPSHTEKQILVVKTEDEDLRWFERSVFFLLKVECKKQIKGALPSLPPSKQVSRLLSYYSPQPVFPEVEQNHMVDLALWNFWASSKQSRQN